jgi:lysozyme family protein
MADFGPAMRKTLRIEQGYNTNPRDPGGETLFGIARRHQPNWAGWLMVDSLKNHLQGPELAKALNTHEGLLASAQQYYQRNFWHFDQVKDQGVANKLFDMSVNMGQDTAAKILQRSAGVDVDGVLGPKTMAAVNGMDPEKLMNELRIQSALHYRDLVAKNSKLQEFLPDWLARARK